MKSIQAIITGSAFILIANLVLQLIFLFVIVEYNTLSKEMNFISGIGEYSRYLIAIPAFILIMFLGGYITANIVRTKIILHCSIVGILAVIGLIAPLLSSTELTITGGILFALSFLAVIFGGLQWQKKARKNGVIFS